MTEQASLTPDLPSSTWLMSEIEMLCLAKMSTVSGQGAHAVGDLQAHIVLGLELVHRLKGEVVTIGGSISGSGATPRLICSESDRISPTTALAVGEGACAGTVEHGFAHGVTRHVDGVHGAVDLGEHMVCRDERGMHADVDAGVGVACDAQQLDGVAELAGPGDVLGADGTDTLLVDIVGGHAGAKADGSEDCRLAGGSKPSTSADGSASA